MNLKRVLLDLLNVEQLKELCTELDVEADRPSKESLIEGISGARRAKPEKLITRMTVAQLREALGTCGEPTGGNRDALVARLLEAGGRGGNEYVEAQAGEVRDAQEPAEYGRASRVSDGSGEYRHNVQAVLRPDAGVQDQFLAKKPPKTYRYDSSLDPALSWDEQCGRDLGEWLLGLIVRAAKEGEAKVFVGPQVWKGGGVSISSTADAAQLLQQVSKPFLNWTGKAERHQIDVPTVPLFVHERHSTKAILDGIRHRKARGQTMELFGDPQVDIHENLEAYEHKGPWQNRMILGDSLSVMNSLLEFEGMAGQVQMIYIDPPYGVKFGSNFQPFVRKRDVKHGGDDDMTREPEMVKAYRDTWDLGLHSYLTYLRDRFLVSRELLAETGSVFVQISADNLHHVREVADEVFGQENFLSLVSYVTTSGFDSETLSRVGDYVLWYAKSRSSVKYRKLFVPKVIGSDGAEEYKYVLHADGRTRTIEDAERMGVQPLPDGSRLFRFGPLTSSGANADSRTPFLFENEEFFPGANNHWKVGLSGMERLRSKNLLVKRTTSLAYRLFLDWYPVAPIGSIWNDTKWGFDAGSKAYVVQTNQKIVRRCMLMASDPGDLVLDPTCGSGTTAYVAEQWGRRWITIDTSRVPLALARQRILTATFPYYALKSPHSGPAGGFIYERKQNRKGEETGGLVPHITLKTVANDDPPKMEVLVDRPEENSGVTRVSGPFVVEATIAPSQSLEASGGGVLTEADASTHIQRMTEVLRQSKTLHLPGNRELVLTAIRATTNAEYIHAEAREGDKRIAVVFGPADGAISSTLVFESAREAYFLKYDLLYFFGFAIESNARAMIEDERKLRINAFYVAVTPDVAMSDLLKTTRASEIFSITGLPDVKARKIGKKGPDGQPLYEVELKGLDLFDPETMETDGIKGEEVPCWMLDTDYNGFSFIASQVFFPRTSAWDNLQRSLGATFDDSVWTHLAGTVSEPFALGERKRVAVKVIDERGNELMRVLEIAE